MSEPVVARYGSWGSPITSDRIVAASLRLGQLAVDGEDLYWTEGRPAEQGRNVLVRLIPGGTPEDVTPAGYNVRTRVHEYGGGAFMVDGGTAYFTHYPDQRLYRQRPGEAPEALTPAPPPGVDPPLRFADFVPDRGRNRLLCVQEDHRGGGHEPENSLVALHLETGALTPLAQGYDFYAYPRLSPDGQQLAWMCWNHPEMPWTASEIWLADLDADGQPTNPRKVAGGPGESVFQPEWSPDGVLYFVSDRTGWWNLYRLRGEAAEPVAPRDAEFGQPLWVFGTSTYAFLNAHTLVCSYCELGVWRLARLDLQTNTLQDLEQPYTTLGDIHASGDTAYFLGGSPTEPGSLVRLDLETSTVDVLRHATEIDTTLRPYFSVPETVAYPSADGQTAYAFFYPPHNPDFVAPEGELPPLLVKCHGGPTGATSNTLSLGNQYWTSRGWAVLDVNYGGSTGYGRAYRDRLLGKWGIVDVDDCAEGAQAMARAGKVDGHRMAITGGSAGGYTTLAALAFRNVFQAGASHFGVSDLEALARDTHKFESRYLDSLVGPYPEAKAIYEERSPLRHADQVKAPMAFFQGAEDRVVPPNQTEMMVDALRANGVPVAYLLFEGEQHGFRRAINIQRALDGELFFYSVVLLDTGLRY